MSKSSRSKSRPIWTIALDAFGSDHAPSPEVEGALRFCRRFHQKKTPLAEVILVGDSARLTEELAKRHVTVVRSRAPDVGLTLVHAPQVIAMDEVPTEALRRKRGSSMHRTIELVKEGRAHAFVTAGNSGAALAVATLSLGRLEGAERPALAGVFPRAGGATLVLDLGANAECKPAHLVEFATMGGIYAHAVLALARPRVGLLSNGTESSKGTAVTRAAHELLSSAESEPFEYVGYVEGNNLWDGTVDVAVVDGFTGNVVLKTVESLALDLVGGLRDELSKSPFATVAWALAKPAVKRVLKKTDYAQVGGAPLLGVNGTAIVAHGRSNAIAIENALGLALRAAETDATGQLAEGLRRTPTSLKDEQ